MRTKSQVIGRLVASVGIAAILSSSMLPSSATVGTASTQAALDAVKAQDEAPGAGAVVRHGGQMWSLSSGTRVLNKDLPFGPDHKMRIGSLTKTFTAAVVMQLVAEKRIDLDASVETYLPGVVRGNGYDGSKITVRQLLNHTSGIAEYLSLEVLLNPANQLETHTLEELASWGLSHKPMFEPGTDWRYSDTNYILAGMIIEKVTGHTYEDQLRSRILEPLALAETYLPEPGDKVLPPEHVRGYVRKTVLGAGFFVDTTDFIEPSMGLSGGGMVSTGSDVTRFYQALLTGHVVPPALLAEMLEPNGIPDAAHPDYGLGVDQFPLPCGGEAWGHYGRWPGYVVYAAATRDGRTAAVVVNNFDHLLAASSSPSGGVGPADVTVPLTTALCEKR